MSILDIDGRKFKTVLNDNFSKLDLGRYRRHYWWHGADKASGDLGRTIGSEDEIYWDTALGDPNPFTTGKKGLGITARLITAEERAAHPYAYYDRVYGSGLLTTEDTVEITYGYAEATMLLPMDHEGVFPAFWFCSRRADAPTKNELDVMEAVDTRGVHFTVHAGTKANPFKDHRGIKPVDLTVPHRYGAIWTEKEIVMVLDGVVREDTRQPNPGIHNPMMVCLNLAVGGEWEEGVIDVRTGKRRGQPNPAQFKTPAVMRVSNLTVATLA